jgi:hypothetical protein
MKPITIVRFTLSGLLGLFLAVGNIFCYTWQFWVIFLIFISYGEVRATEERNKHDSNN